MSNIDLFKEYTKEEIIIAIKNVYKCEERVLQNLPLIKYNSMCEDASKIQNEASMAMMDDKIQLAKSLIDKSNKLYEKANKFIDNHLKYKNEKANRRQQGVEDDSRKSKSKNMPIPKH